MGVDTASVLRVLAHELRSPAGVAQGYLRMTLDGRLPSPGDQRHALEQTRQAVDRMSAIGREASEIASWLERPGTAPTRKVGVRALLDPLLDRHHNDFDVSLADLNDAALVATLDEAALAKALTSVITAVARESPGTRLTLTTAFATATAVKASSGESSDQIDLAFGPPHLLPQLRMGPSAPGAGSISLERGGLGLSLVMAVLVLDAHRIVAWTINEQRGALGLRFPAETGHAS